ncbi:hypothetical protein DPSP01_005433 [Paraphaeosphaeria sporulosa]
MPRRRDNNPKDEEEYEQGDFGDFYEVEGEGEEEDEEMRWDESAYDDGQTAEQGQQQGEEEEEEGETDTGARRIKLPTLFRQPRNGGVTTPFVSRLKPGARDPKRHYMRYVRIRPL